MVTSYATDENGERISVPVKRIRFKLADKRSALVDLGKHLGMFREKVDIEWTSFSSASTASPRAAAPTARPISPIS